MKKLFKSILGIMVMFAIVLFVTALTTPQTPEYESELSFAGEASASFYAVQSPPTNLYSGISSSASTARLRSFNDIGGDELTMSMFGDIGYVTFEPGTLGKEEVASFTGITDNGDGTQTITGLTRGLYGRYPFGAGGSATSHGSNTYVVVSNPGDFYNHFAIKENDESITGVYTFSSTSQPVYDGGPTFTDANSLISKGYADGLVASGVATSSETTFGGAKLATQLEMASSSYSVTDPKVLYSRYSTSSPDGTPAAYYALILNAAGKIAQSAIDLTVSWAFGDDVTVGGTLGVTGTSTMATTTVTDLTVSSTASSSDLIVSATTTTENLVVNGNVDFAEIPTKYYVTYFTKNLADESNTGTTTITHNLGRTPKLIKISHTRSGNTSDGATSFGAWYSDGQSCIATYLDGTSYSASSVTVGGISSGILNTGTIINVGISTFQISWVKTGAPTGEPYFFVEVEG